MVTHNTANPPRGHTTPPPPINTYKHTNTPLPPPVPGRQGRRTVQARHMQARHMVGVWGVDAGWVWKSTAYEQKPCVHAKDAHRSLQHHPHAPTLTRRANSRTSRRWERRRKVGAVEANKLSSAQRDDRDRHGASGVPTRGIRNTHENDAGARKRTHCPHATRAGVGAWVWG
jgi:hypothetical protein